jgi:hypothetical protein
MHRRDKFDLSLIFPIKDAPSACLMGFKADCLFRAGVISEDEWQRVHADTAARTTPQQPRNAKQAALVGDVCPRTAVGDSDFAGA